MLSLYLEHGKNTVEEVLRWIPVSRWYCNPEAELDTIADLQRKWKYVSAECEKYLDRAVESGTEDRCQDWIDQRFCAAGGDNAEFLCHERLHPISPEDAAEEAAMDAYDDEHDVEVLNPWAEDDQADHEKESDGGFKPWAEEDDCTPAYESRGADQSDEVDEDNESVPLHCENRDSMQAGTCVPDDDFDVE